METAGELVANVTELISFPEIAMRINESLDDENSTAEKVSAIIETDPALTAGLLRLANSPLYGGSGIDSVNKAIVRVGAREIRELTFGICATRAFSGIPNDLLSVEDFWRHSLACAVSARMIARKIRLPQAGMVFTAGLLHDVGHLIMFSQRPEPSTQALLLSRNEMDGEDLYLAEREVFGFDHMDVGRALGEQWNWPDSLIECIAHHHEPFAVDCGNQVAVVHIANSIATLAELGSRDIEDASPSDERAWQALGIEPETLIEGLDDLNDSAEPLLQLMVA